MNPSWMKELLRDAATEGGTGGGEAKPAAGEGTASEGAAKSAETKSFFNPDAGSPGEKKGEAGGEQAGSPPPATGDRPPWLHEKFQTPEDLAKAYTELERKWFTKNDVLKEELRESIAKEVRESANVPEKPDDYKYPEGVDSPAPEIDGVLRKWAHDNGIGKEVFQSLINDVWIPNLPDPDAELEKLGENAQDRVDLASSYLARHIPKELHRVAKMVMTTAEGVEFVEALMGVREGGVDTPQKETAKPLTRESIREMQADPRFGTDEEYTQMVRGLWAKFAAQPQR